MEIVPTGSVLGAEIRGLDVSRPLDETTVDAIRRAVQEHLLVFFRGQELTEEAQVRFTRYFGEPRVHVREQRERRVPEIFLVSNVLENGEPIGSLGYGELTFHSDLSYLDRPGSYSIVYAVEVPERGGDTQWANCYAAYEALPEDLRARVVPLRAVHRHGEDKQNPEVPAVHPVVRTHPDTGRRALYVSHQFTRRIEGLPEDEGRELLDTLLTHVSRPEFVWTHKWKAGDVVLWDNRCTLHRREPFDERERRILKRTQIFGEVPCT
jgi:alpha-ketoglutarate-dependent taurine dioxygenase